MGRSSVKLHIAIVQCLRGLGLYKSWGLCSTETQWNKMEFQEIGVFQCTFVWDISPITYYLFVISYSPKKLKLPSVFCHFRIWGSAAPPSIWFSWHILLPFTWISLFQSSNYELWHCIKSWAWQALPTEPCPGWALDWQGHMRSHTRKESGSCHSVTAD